MNSMIQRSIHMAGLSLVVAAMPTGFDKGRFVNEAAHGLMKVEPRKP